MFTRFSSHVRCTLFLPCTLSYPLDLFSPRSKLGQVTNDTCLEEARALIDTLLRPSERTYGFLSIAGGVVPLEDEQARRVVWDCKIPVQLRPASWVAIGRV